MKFRILPVPVMSLDQRGVVVDAKDVRQCPRCPADIEIPSVQHFLCNTLGGGELFPARIQQLGDSSLFAICLLNCDVEVAAIVPRTGRTNRMQATARSGLYVFHKVICSPSPDPRRSPASRGIAELHVAADWTPASREIQTLQRTLLRRADEVPHSAWGSDRQGSARHRPCHRPP